MRRFLHKKRIWIRFHISEPCFCFFSRIFLARWRPDVIVVTGAVGKTSLLHLLKEQLGDEFAYSHRSNSKTGITLNMLGIAPPGRHRWRWLFILPMVPLKAFFGSIPKESRYLVEYDAFDPTSGDYFKWWLRPKLAVWLTVSQAHVENFDGKARSAGCDPMDLVVAEFRRIAGSASQLIFAPRGNRVIEDALKGVDTPVKWIKNDLVAYEAGLEKTSFKTKQREFVFGHPLPEPFGQTLALMAALVEHLGYDIRQDLRHWHPPPGRSTLLSGHKGCYLIDSSYNAQIESFLAVIDMFKQMKAGPKWLVCGDMLEQGSLVAQGHRRLADALVDLNPNRLFLVGPRTGEHVGPVLRRAKVEFDHLPRIDGAFLERLKDAISGGEVILFKGAGFLGALVEALLADPADRQWLDAPGHYSHMLK